MNTGTGELVNFKPLNFKPVLSMARQAGPFFFTGTIGDVIFYKLGDNYYVRMKGSYNTKALQKPGARPLMQLRQKEFGEASKLASEVYKTVPPRKRSKALFNTLTKQARQLLRNGMDKEKILEMLTPVVEATSPVVQQPKAQQPAEQAAMAKLSVKKKVVTGISPNIQVGHIRTGVSAKDLPINGQLYLKALPDPILSALTASFVPLPATIDVGTG